MKMEPIRELGRAGWRFYCPGCEENHSFYTLNDNPSKWAFNGNHERPTFTPSLLITTGCFTNAHKAGDSCWCTFNAEEVAKGNTPSSFKCGRCHLFLTDGKLQFLGDSTHQLAGQTVELSELKHEVCA